MEWLGVAGAAASSPCSSTSPRHYSAPALAGKGSRPTKLPHTERWSPSRSRSPWVNPTLDADDRREEVRHRHVVAVLDHALHIAEELLCYRLAKGLVGAQLYPQAHRDSDMPCKSLHSYSQWPRSLRGFDKIPSRSELLKLGRVGVPESGCFITSWTGKDTPAHILDVSSRLRLKSTAISRMSM
jgi:hypothetical protein